MRKMHHNLPVVMAVSIGIAFGLGVDISIAKETLVIAASPSLAIPLEALGREFEAKRPDVLVQIFYDTGLALRQTIAAMENKMDQSYFGKGPIHLVAPGGDELITRLQQKYYVLPGTAIPYATEPLVLVVPESLIEAPASFEELAKNSRLRVAVADPTLTVLGQKTIQLLHNLGIQDALKGRLDVAADARGVLDHLLSGNADVGIVFGPDAVQESQRVRIAAVSPEKLYKPTVHSMAMERFCPDRALCEQFLTFVQTPEAQSVLKHLGYGLPRK